MKAGKPWRSGVFSVELVTVMRLSARDLAHWYRGVAGAWADTRTYRAIAGRARSPRVEEVSLKIICLPGRLRVLSYRVMPDVPVHLVLFVSRLLADRRRETGTRRGTRALTCFCQAVFVLAWFRDRPDIARLGRGFGISQATAYRYLNEAIDVLAARAPTLRQALEKAREFGLPYLILDGTIVASDRYCGAGVTQVRRDLDGHPHHERSCQTRRVALMPRPWAALTPSLEGRFAQRVGLPVRR